ncbi:accessory Sec system glycosyltransferase Asp1 [Lactiplantibacillus herbarum]|uniref:accessory Sec system glycosyltransferase Asp1 n=1 Tax=Lactiplantibacillus herbarum TaxID=1670446 RepID=UPI00064E66AB|nr:accessory Sec system glycosyltransferase Asp1 [Lactiplantibacillus herbarum]
MFYFINEYLLSKNSSVEHTAMNRVKLFNHYKAPAQIVTKMYDRLLHQTITNFDIKGDQVLSMFDYFQQTTDVQPEFVRTMDLNLPREYAVEVGADFSKVFNGDHLVSHVGFIPGTVGRVFYQNFFDAQGNLATTDLWDWRGFRSGTQYFGQNGQLIMERFYNLQGETVIEEYYVPDTNGNPLTNRLILKNYQGCEERFFQNTDDLFTFFLAELSHRDKDVTTFISDRPGTSVASLLALNDDSHKYVLVPVYHAKDINDPLHSQLDGFLAPAFEHAEHFDGFITSTVSQTQHLQQRFPKAKLMTLPAVTTGDMAHSELRPITERPHQLIFVGRLAPDRQLDHLMRVIALVKQRVDNVHCDLYGYGDDAYVQTLNAMITDLKLTKNVRIMDYHADLDTRYDDYQLLVNTAIADGGPMSMPEAMGHGIPVISYQFNYGPKDFIDEGKDGYVVAPGNQMVMRDRISDLLLDPKLLTAFSEAAFNKLHTEQTDLKVWHRWQQALGIK